MRLGLAESNLSSLCIGAAPECWMLFFRALVQMFSKKGTHLGREEGGVMNFFLLTVEAMGSRGRAC